MTTEIEKLGLTLDRRIRRVNGANREVFTEVGTIVSGKKLKIPALGNIPEDEYSVCEHVKDLAAGDEVLVIWSLNEPIIVGKLK